MSSGELYVGDGLTPEERGLCSTASDSGTYDCAEVLSGRYIFFQITADDTLNDGAGDQSSIQLSEMRAYGLKNLSSSASIFFATKETPNGGD